MGTTADLRECGFDRARRSWRGAGVRELGQQRRISQGHAGQPSARHRTRAGGSPSASRCRSPVPRRAPSRAISSPHGRHRVHAAARRSLHRRLLLARVPGARNPGACERGLLVGEARQERGAGRRHERSPLRVGMDCSPLLGARGSARGRRVDLRPRHAREVIRETSSQHHRISSISWCPGC